MTRCHGPPGPMAEADTPLANVAPVPVDAAAGALATARRTSAWRLLGPTDWARIAVSSVAAGLLIALPTRLVPTSLFRRMTPTRPQDYVFWVVGALLTGAVLGLRRADPLRGDRVAVTGGTGTLLAVGCPVCNKLVVALLGVGGATSIFAPMQPVLALASIGLLAWALRVRLRALSSAAASAGACPVAR